MTNAHLHLHLNANSKHDRNHTLIIDLPTPPPPRYYYLLQTPPIPSPSSTPTPHHQPLHPIIIPYTPSSTPTLHLPHCNPTNKFAILQWQKYIHFATLRRDNLGAASIFAEIDFTSVSLVHVDGGYLADYLGSSERCVREE